MSFGRTGPRGPLYTPDGEMLASRSQQKAHGANSTTLTKQGENKTATDQALSQTVLKRTIPV